MARDLPTILVTGASGQVGRALQAALPRLGRVVAVDLPEVDFTKPDEVLALVRELRPQAIVNPAAYTAVDKAESEPELARQINAVTPAALAREAARLGIPFIHYSTDYVYDGTGRLPRKEDAPTSPLNTYGRTKLEGDTAVLAAGGTPLVLRTSWVFSHVGQNFVKTMLRLGAEREELRVVADQIGSPTSAAFLAAMTTRLLERGFAQGFAGFGAAYHLANAGETSWHGFAEEIFRQARARGQVLKVRVVHPIRSDEYLTPALRPRNSRLDCGRFRETFAVQELQTWQDALSEVLAAL